MKGQLCQFNYTNEEQCMLLAAFTITFYGLLRLSEQPVFSGMMCADPLIIFLSPFINQRLIPFVMDAMLNSLGQIHPLTHALPLNVSVCSAVVSTLTPQLIRPADSALYHVLLSPELLDNCYGKQGLMTRNMHHTAFT